ncbi:MAG: non-ribosomal peptide synthetase, partial [bacterium]|nr:non-ribosomal peptide synthetase [bacterium]
KAPRLPVDFPDGGNSVTAIEMLGVALDPEATRALLGEVPKAYRTRIDEVLLTALAMACAPWTGEQRLLVELEGHGREEFIEGVDLSRTVGWFTSIHPLRLELPDDGPGTALKAIKEQVRAVPNRGVGYGLLRYLRGDDALSRRLAALPSAEVSFNYLGQFDPVLPDSALLKPARESAGLSAGLEGQRRHLLEINAQISGGQLRLDWRYSRELHRRDTIRALADRYL